MLRRTTTVYDLAGRVKAVVDANNHRVTNVYDAASQRIALVDARNNRTTFAYDLAGNEILVKDPLGGRTTSVYDASNCKIKRTDARGNRTTYAYDAANRQVQRKYPDGTRVTQVYDVIGNRTLLQDATGRYTAVYDPLDRLSTRTNPASKRLTYTYDGISQRRRLADPDGGLFTTVYDANQRIIRVINPQSSRTTFGYDTADRRKVKVLGNSSRTSFSYDDADRLTRVVNIKSSGVTISSFGYGYDKTTRRTNVVEATGDRVTWSYDPTYQLVNEKRSGVNSYNVTYTYDPAGNRTVKLDSGALTTSTYDAANRLSYTNDSTGRTTFTFDKAGNQTKQVSPTLQITTSVWDYENMNTATLLPGASRVTLVYNGDLLRVEKDSSSGTHKLIYDGQNILLETDGSNLTQAAYTLEPKEFGNLISQRQNQSGTWVPLYYAFDALGSTDSLTDSSQVITDTYTYLAFGVIKNGTGSTPNSFTWVGQLLYVQDPETGEVQVHLRQIRPDLGRMKSQDPLGVGPDMNQYRIVKNDPVNIVDPSGTEGLTDDVRAWRKLQEEASSIERQRTNNLNATIEARRLLLQSTPPNDAESTESYRQAKDKLAALIAHDDDLWSRRKQLEAVMELAPEHALKYILATGGPTERQWAARSLKQRENREYVRQRNEYIRELESQGYTGDEWFAIRMENEREHRDTMAVIPGIAEGAYARLTFAVTDPGGYFKDLISGQVDFILHPIRSITDLVLEFPGLTPREGGKVIGAAAVDAGVTAGATRGVVKIGGVALRVTPRISGGPLRKIAGKAETGIKVKVGKAFYSVVQDEHGLAFLDEQGQSVASELKSWQDVAKTVAELTGKTASTIDSVPTARLTNQPIIAIAESGELVHSTASRGYHGLSGVSVEEVIADGLSGGGTNFNLAEHVGGATDTAFRGLGPLPGRGGSAGLKTPVEFAGEGGIVVQVEGVPGFDTRVHAPKAVASLRRGEAEVATPRRIPTERIRQIGIVGVDRLGREVITKWIPNPNYKPMQ